MVVMLYVYVLSSLQYVLPLACFKVGVQSVLSFGGRGQK